MFSLLESKSPNNSKEFIKLLLFLSLRINFLELLIICVFGLKKSIPFFSLKIFLLEESFFYSFESSSLPNKQ